MGPTAALSGLYVSEGPAEVLRTETQMPSDLRYILLLLCFSLTLDVILRPKTDCYFINAKTSGSFLAPSDYSQTS